VTFTMIPYATRTRSVIHVFFEHARECRTPSRYYRLYPRHSVYPPLAQLTRPGFIIGGLVYLALLAALYLPLAQLERYRNVVRWVLIGFTALSIFLWVLLGDRTAIGYTAKAIEVALILLLLLDARGSRL
jgi:hypothetical protein